MKVVKIKSEWFPSESPFLKVGESIDITDPRELLASGVVKEYIEEIRKEEPKAEVKIEPIAEVKPVEAKPIEVVVKKGKK